MSPDDATELLLKTAWIAEPSDIISSLASDMVKVDTNQSLSESAH